MSPEVLGVDVDGEDGLDVVVDTLERFFLSFFMMIKARDG